MGKFYAVLMCFFFYVVTNAQVLNQPANWPNSEWTITGTYNSDVLAFESNPLTTSNFAYDDNEAGDDSHDDQIAAESLRIDLSAAYAANEKAVEITVSYAYFFLDDDVLQFQFWDADANNWKPWPGANIPGTTTEVTDDFCLGLKSQFTTVALNISGFTPTQLSGFKYRISYDDKIGGPDWNYGFCFESPVIRSLSCISPSNFRTTILTSDGCEISWDAIEGSNGFEYVFDENPEAPSIAGTTTMNPSFSMAGLSASTQYYLHVRTNCGNGFSSWRTLTFSTGGMVPENDACVNAVAIGSFPYENSLDATLATNNDGFVEGCDSAMNDGVWYQFTGNGFDVSVDVKNVNGWDPKIGVFSGMCGNFSCEGSADETGYEGEESLTIFATEIGKIYYVNIGHYNENSDNPEGPFAISVRSSNLGTQSQFNDNLKYWPNPVRDFFNISHTDEITNIAVYNVMGQQVLAENIDSKSAQLDFSGFKSGSYFVKINTNLETKTVKLIRL